MLEGVEISCVTDEQRARAKTVNFGLIYGMSAFGLAKQLSVSIFSAQAIIDRYFSIYPGVYLYMSTMREQSKKQGYVETLMGRRIPIHPQHTKSGGDNSWRAAINGPLQGTASELIKKAMLHLQPLLDQDKRVSMIMQVHDELVFEVPLDLLPDWASSAQKIMESSMLLRVPLRVNYCVGSCWE
jgi:DNA polymerase-1